MVRWNMRSLDLADYLRDETTGAVGSETKDSVRMWIVQNITGL
jgi:hypothetical protein